MSKKTITQEVTFEVDEEKLPLSIGKVRDYCEQEVGRRTADIAMRLMADRLNDEADAAVKEAFEELRPRLKQSVKRMMTDGALWRKIETVIQEGVVHAVRKSDETVEAIADLASTDEIGKLITAAFERVREQLIDAYAKKIQAALR